MALALPTNFLFTAIVNEKYNLFIEYGKMICYAPSSFNFEAMEVVMIVNKSYRTIVRNIRIAVISCIMAVSFSFSMNVSADLTWFSRANCINNESITWDAWDPEWLWTNTYHYRYGVYLHCDNNVGDGCTGNAWQLTWRAAAVHWSEGFGGGYYVYGLHWRWSPSTGTYLLGSTSATGCNPTHW